MLADDNVHEVERLIGKTKIPDIDRVYSAWQNGSDYFVTNDKTDLIRDGRREQLESLLPGLRIRTMVEFLSELDDA